MTLAIAPPPLEPYPGAWPPPPDLDAACDRAGAWLADTLRAAGWRQVRDGAWRSADGGETIERVAGVGYVRRGA